MFLFDESYSFFNIYAPVRIYFCDQIREWRIILQLLASEDAIKLVTLYDLDKTYLRSVLNKNRFYKILTNNGYISLKSSELTELIIENQNKDELRKLVVMIKTIRKRNTCINSYVQTIAIALLH